MASSIPFPAPQDHRWVMAESENWRPVTGKHCRRMTADRKICGAPSVAEMNRGRWRAHTGRFDAWWAYCLEHAYGHWLEDGKVWHWRLVRNEA